MSSIQGTVIDLAQDTLTDAGTVNMAIGAKFTGTYTLSVSFKATNSTGTTAGTAKLQQSVNGTDYDDIAGLTDLTVTNGAVAVWSLTATPAVKYRINIVGTGTQSTLVDGSYIFK
jgi:hypothetical protein